MENNLKMFRKEDDLNFLLNGRQTIFYLNGRQPQYSFELKTTSFIFKWKTTSIYIQMEENLKKKNATKTIKS